MKIDALKFLSGSPVSSTTPLSLDIDLAQPLPVIEDGDVVVLLVALENFTHIRSCDERIEDLGRKPTNKGLWDKLRSVSRLQVGMVDGNYTAEKQVRRSIRDLIKRLSQTADAARLVIVGTKPEIFERLKRLAANRENGSVFTPRKGHARANAGPHRPPQQENGCSGLLAVINHDPQLVRPLGEHYVGRADSVELVRVLILKAADADCPVLILGPTGTGKEVIARQIHDRSGRKTQPFISVNCGAIPSALFESELFGHEKGAFTDAKARKEGLWRVAEHGTLFLDEIGDLPMEHQAKVLRALGSHKGRAVGGTEEYDLHARILAATNRDLGAMVETKHFREDLYYRLRVISIPTPALRDHMEDLPVIARHLWRCEAKGAKELPGNVIAELAKYSWPGNVRELKMTLFSLHALFHKETVLQPRHVWAVFQLNGQSPTALSRKGLRTSSVELEHSRRMRHLRRASEAVLSTESILRPALEDSPKGRPNVDAQLLMLLKLRQEELDILCRQFRLLGELIFNAVQRLRGKLVYLHGLLAENTQEGCRFWRQEVAPELAGLNDCLRREMERVEKEGN